MPVSNHFITQGHRGARGLLPENTLDSFRCAFDAGMDRVEVDLNLTRDLELIVFHDESTHPDLVRREGQWLTRHRAWYGMDYAEVKQLDVGRIRPGSDYAARFPQQKPVDGAPIPRLADIACLLNDPAWADKCITLEVKCAPDALAPRPEPVRYSECIVEEIHRLQLANRVTVQSFNWDIIREVKRLDPQLALGCLSSEIPDFDTIGRQATGESLWTAGLAPADFGFSVPKMVKAMGVQYWSSEYRDLNPQNIAEAHALGLEVHAWTVNDPDSMKQLLQWSVDSIISDYPNRLQSVVVEEHNQRVVR